MPAHDAAPCRRTFACRTCGALRRADTPRYQTQPPVCCGEPIQNLAHEQAVAATQLTPEKRVRWLAAGGGIVHRGGKRPWKAVFRPVEPT